MYPSFLCIGAQRSGSTWLDRNLRKHPNLWLPAIKELHYFNYKQNNYLQKPINKIRNQHWRREIRGQLQACLSGADVRKTLLWNVKYFTGDQSDRWYASLFEPEEHQIAGEVTPDYSALNEETVQHIHRIMPDTKIIFMLRNPIRRAWSYVFSHTLRGENIEEIPTDTLIEHCTKRYSLLRGSYSRTISIWRSCYPKEQFFIGFFEEIAEKPEGLISRICSFLNVPANDQYLSTIEKKKVYSFGDTDNMPIEVAKSLAQQYHKELSYLSSEYGGYAEQWLEYAENILG